MTPHPIARLAATDSLAVGRQLVPSSRVRAAVSGFGAVGHQLVSSSRVRAAVSGFGAVGTVIAALVVAPCLAGCDNGQMTPDWSRMITQPKLLPYGASDLFADQRAMRPLPAGVVARERVPDPMRRTGRDAAGADAAAVPVPITRALLERGRDRFAITCAPCHGIAGDGNSVVAHDMQRRRPPSLHEPRIAALPPGAMFRAITAGYGLMPSYETLLSSDDRWAVVAYVRTLELSWTAKLDALPPTVRDDIARRLP